MILGYTCSAEYSLDFHGYHITPTDHSVHNKYQRIGAVNIGDEVRLWCKVSMLFDLCTFSHRRSGRKCIFKGKKALKPSNSVSIVTNSEYVEKKECDVEQAVWSGHYETSRLHGNNVECAITINVTAEDWGVWSCYVQATNPLSWKDVLNPVYALGSLRNPHKKSRSMQLNVIGFGKFSIRDCEWGEWSAWTFCSKESVSYTHLTLPTNREV